MSINFPNSPTVGQKFVGGSRPFKYDGTVWNADDYYAAISQNLIDNSEMAVSQENGNNAAPQTAGVNWDVADRWRGDLNLNASTGTSHRYQFPNDVPSSNEPALGHGGAILLYIAAAVAPGPSNYAHLYQYIEGRRAGILRWGTPYAIPAVLRFWVWSTVPGTYAATVMSASGNTSFAGAYTINAPNYWQEVIIPIPAKTTGVWPTDETAWGHLSFGAMWGTSYTNGVPGWNDLYTYAFPGVANFSGPGHYFRITRVGLYPDPFGSGAPPLHVYPQYSDDLLACMRHWYRCYCPRGVWGNPAGGARFAINHPVNMRVAPSITLRGPNCYIYSGAAGASNGTLGYNYCTEDYYESEFGAPSGGFTVGHVGCNYIGAGPENYIAVNARLSG